MSQIFLQYMTHSSDNARMTKLAAMKICALFDWDVQKLDLFFKDQGWVFDNDYGFSFDEFVTHMKVVFTRESKLTNTAASVDIRHNVVAGVPR